MEWEYFISGMVLVIAVELIAFGVYWIQDANTFGPKGD